MVNPNITKTFSEEKDFSFSPQNPDQKQYWW